MQTKLYSAASNKKDTRVFRFYCELKEEVDSDVLQEALNQTIETFPTIFNGASQRIILALS